MLQRPKNNPSGLNDENHKQLISELTKYAQEGASDDDLKKFKEAFISQKKKSVSQPTSQENVSVSKPKQKVAPTLSVIEETQTPVESDGLGGPPKMKTFTGFTPEEQQTLQAKPAIKVPKSSELIGKRLKLQKELSTTKVTPENQDEILRKTDELSAVIKAQDEISNLRLSEIENQFKQAKNEEAVDIESNKRLDDLLTNNGVWNNVKAASLNIYNNLIDQAASITDEPGIKELKADVDPLSEEKKEVKKDAANKKISLSEDQINELAKQLYKDKQADYIETDNINSFLDNLDENDKNLLKQSRAKIAEHLQERNLKEEKVINAYEVIGNKKIKEYRDLEQQLLNYKNNNQALPKDVYDSYVSLGNEIVGIGNTIQKKQTAINKNKEDLGTAQQEFDLLKRRYGDIDNIISNIGLGGTKILNGILGFTNYAAKFGGGLQGELYSMAGQKVTDKIGSYISEEEDQLRKNVESIESPEGLVNYVSDIVAKQIPNLVATSTGIGGLGVIGISSTGEKFTQMNKEVLEGKATYSPLEMAVAPALWGSAEVISEIPTLSILTKGGRVFDSIVKNEGDLIAKSVKEKAKEWAKDWSVDMSKEVTGEEFTNFAQNFTDKYVLGKKDVGLLDNAGTVLKDTFTLTNVLKGAPHVAGAILKLHQNNSDLNILDENSKKIIEFSKQLENESLNDTEKAVITRQIEKATAQNSNIIANTIEKVNNMPDDVYRKIIDLNNKVADIKIEAVAVNEGNLPNKAELIKSLESDYRAAQTERNALIDAKYEPTEEVVTEEVTPTEEVVTEEVVTPIGIADEYIQSIEKVKTESPEIFWSVDRPFQKEDGTIDKAQLDKAAEEDRIIKTDSGFGVVGEDGDIKGVFKADLNSTEKTGDKVIQEAIKKGGIKLDNFALPNLMKIYERNGFREVSRLPFNEEYAPEGWTPEQGTPDVVAMVYDPNGELNIEKKTFTDYDEAMKYRDGYLNEVKPVEVKPTAAKTKLEAFKAKYINKPAYDRTKLDTQVDNAKKSLSNILPNVKFVVHDTKESFIGVAGKNGRGYYDPSTKTIHINALEANARTVPHEVFHSILLDKVKTDANARELTKRMISSIAKTLEGNPDLKKTLDDFIKNYDENVQSEEKMAELFGYLADGYEGFDAPTKSIIKRAMDRLAKMFGLKPFTEGEIVDMLKTLSGKIATGEEIISKDTEIFKGGKKVDTPSDGLTKKFQYGNDKVNLEIKYLEQDRIDELKQSGLLTEPENLSELNGKRVVTTSPDDMLVGSILVNGKEVAVGNGGVYFVTKFGDVWANSNKGVANGLANAINETYDPKTGKSYLALVKGTDAKLVSSPQGVTSSLAVTESMIDAGLFSLSDFRSAVRSAVKSSGGSISLSPNGSAKVLKSEVDNFFKDVTSSTFEKRGNVLRDIVSNLAKSESAKNNKNEIISFLDGDKNKGLGVGKTEKSQSLIDLIAKTSAEKLTKGLNTGDVYAVIEIDGKVKVVQDSHQSYPYHIKIVDENGNVSNKKPVLILPKTRSNGKEILTSLEGKTAEELGTAFSGKVGATANMPYGKGIIMDNPKGRLQETEDYSDMKDIVNDMINDGMSITEIKKTISSELGADQISLAERAYNELTTVKEEVIVKEPTGAIEDFRDKVKDLPKSGIVGKYLSGETIEMVEGEAPRNAQETEVMSLIDAGMHGKETVVMAKEVFGDKYIEKTLEFLDTANLKPHEKAVLYVSLENEMFDRVNAEPDNVGLKKLQDLVRAKSQQFLRESSLAINAGRLRAIMKDGFNYETVTDKFLSGDQLRDKKNIEKAIQSDSDAIQKEYESIVTESDLEQMILSGVEKQVNEIYKKLPTARRVKADKAIAALEKIQDKLRGKAYDATVGIPIALIDSGITIIKNSIKAGVSIADAIEIGINHIKEKYGNDWANEGMFRDDMTQGFKTEGITEKEIKAKELSNKEIVNQALIDAGFGKEITVRTKQGKVKRNVLDWKKLAGEEGSVDKIRENVEGIVGKEAAKELEDEYNNLRASIIEKSLNELENRNTPRKKVDLKTSAKKLAELYNYGLFEKESDTYDRLINTALGMNQLDQKSFDEAKALAKSLSELFSQEDSNGNKLSQEYLKFAERSINKKIERLLSDVAWSQSNGAYKAVVVAKEFIGLAQRNALVSVAQAIENTTSGYISRAFKKIGFMFDNVDTKEMKDSRNKLAKMTFKDITMNGGLEFGDVTSPFITKSKTMDLIINASDSRLYHALTSIALGKPFLESADSMHKAALAQGFFHYNLIKILRKKGMSKTEAKNYVSEQLTGQSFEDALVTSKQIIDKINENAGKKVISDSKESVYRFANDLVNEALVQGNKITLDELEASLKSAETVAGFELGHEPNNIISKPLNLFNSWVQTRTDRAVKEKKWNDAAALTAASIVTTNILNPYVGGGTNWTLLAAQKAGIPTLSTIYWNIKSRGSKLDLSTEEGMKNLEKDLKYQLLAKNANARMFIGAAVTLAAFALASATGSDDDLYEWLEKNTWAKKYMKKMNPPAVQFMLAQKDKKLGEFLGQQMNIKADAFDEGKKLQQALKNAASGKTQKALGGAGQLVGSRLSTPIIPWRVVKDVRDIYRGLNGLPPIEYDYKSSGFGSGYFQGGMIEQLGLRPENVEDVDENRGSSGSRESSGNRESSGSRSQGGSRD